MAGTCLFTAPLISHLEWQNLLLHETCELVGVDSPVPLWQVHHLHTGVVLIIDVAQGGRKLFPVASPLPLALHMPPAMQPKAPPAESAIHELLPNYEVYNEDWQFHPPGIAIDVRNGLLWRLEVSSSSRGCLRSSLIGGRPVGWAGN